MKLANQPSPMMMAESDSAGSRITISRQKADEMGLKDFKPGDRVMVEASGEVMSAEDGVEIQLADITVQTDADSEMSDFQQAADSKEA